MLQAHEGVLLCKELTILNTKQQNLSSVLRFLFISKLCKRNHLEYLI